MRKSARIALSSTPPHNYRLLNGQTSSPSRGPASGHGGRPPNTGTVANLVATFNAMGGSREPRGRFPRARSPSPDTARVLFESIPKRARSGVTNPPISVGLALEHLATYGRLQPFEDRRSVAVVQHVAVASAVNKDTKLAFILERVNETTDRLDYVFRGREETGLHVSCETTKDISCCSGPEFL
jgi:hypothetical protein